jgi:hypothetical protein
VTADLRSFDAPRGGAARVRGAPGSGSTGSGGGGNGGGGNGNGGGFDGDDDRFRRLAATLVEAVGRAAGKQAELTTRAVDKVMRAHDAGVKTSQKGDDLLWLAVNRLAAEFRTLGARMDALERLARGTVARCDGAGLADEGEGADRR